MSFYELTVQHYLWFTVASAAITCYFGYNTHKKIKAFDTMTFSSIGQYDEYHAITFINVIMTVVFTCLTTLFFVRGF